MNVRRWSTALALALAAAVLGGVATWALGGEDGHTPSAAASAPDPATAARTSFPGLKAATGEPQLAGIRSAHPRPGTVGTVPGPFDDRFDLGALRVRDGVVVGSLHITSDVSDVLELQVLAGFYDARGHFLGTGRFVHHLTEEKQHDGPPSEEERFTITAPERFRDRASAAVIGVPVLVNE